MIDQPQLFISTLESKLAMRKHLFMLQHETTKRILRLDSEINQLKLTKTRESRQI